MENTIKFISEGVALIRNITYIQIHIQIKIRTAKAKTTSGVIINLSRQQDGINEKSQNKKSLSTTIRTNTIKSTLRIKTTRSVIEYICLWTVWVDQNKYAGTQKIWLNVMGGHKCNFDCFKYLPAFMSLV